MLRLNFYWFSIDQNVTENMEKAELEYDFHPGSGWETVTQEDCDWDILISQLEDTTFLDSVLKLVHFYV